MKKGLKSFGFFCHLLDRYHFVLLYVCVDLIGEGRYVIKQQMMNSLKNYPMLNILKQLKINIETAMKRCHSDDVGLNFSEVHQIKIPVQASGRNDCLIASCCALWHFYRLDLQIGVGNIAVITSNFY